MSNNIEQQQASQPFRRNGMGSKNTICLWYDGDAFDAANFYAETFHDVPHDWPPCRAIR